MRWHSGATCWGRQCRMLMLSLGQLWRLQLQVSAARGHSGCAVFWQLSHVLCQLC